MLTGKKANNGWTVSFSHIRNKKLQGVNLQYKRIYWPEQQRYIRLRISTKVRTPCVSRRSAFAPFPSTPLPLLSLAFFPSCRSPLAFPLFWSAA